eukprot:1764061-Prymnesium_polylepis.2
MSLLSVTDGVARASQDESVPTSGVTSVVPNINQVRISQLISSPPFHDSSTHPLIHSSTHPLIHSPCLPMLLHPSA